MSEDERKLEICKYRGISADGYDKQIAICKEWLSCQLKLKTINKHRNSYGYKHVVERWAGVYISNECMIEAFRICGYTGLRVSDLNWSYNISRRLVVPPKCTIVHDGREPEIRASDYNKPRNIIFDMDLWKWAK